ncbi:MAG: hypothetical protein JSU83_01590 [Deltaproteobacteria bacterium]|nr:MAG: hypothetical protein JSU83_01590 [Deltaproteobacteria bacterium]
MTFNIDRRWYLQFFLLIILNLSWIGCGKKATPVPPRRYIPPAVNDLSYRLTGGTLNLAWTIPEAKKTKITRITGCMVFRAKISISDSDCQTCPAEFESVADVPLEGDRRNTDKPKDMRYSEAIEHGYRYTYKVNCYSKKGISSKDSNYIEIIY